jgi:hypothetical protein
MTYAELEQFRTARKAQAVVYRGGLFERAYRHLQSCFKTPVTRSDYSPVAYPRYWEGDYANKRITVCAGKYSCVVFY